MAFSLSDDSNLTNWLSDWTNRFQAWSDQSDGNCIFYTVLMKLHSHSFSVSWNVYMTLNEMPADNLFSDDSCVVVNQQNYLLWLSFSKACWSLFSRVLQTKCLDDIKSASNNYLRYHGDLEIFSKWFLLHCQRKVFVQKQNLQWFISLLFDQLLKIGPIKIRSLILCHIVINYIRLLSSFFKMGR